MPNTIPSAEDVEFGLAMDRYKREHDRPFPTWHEVLDVLRSLGYRKVDDEARAAIVRERDRAEEMQENR